MHGTGKTSITPGHKTTKQSVNNFSGNWKRGSSKIRYFQHVFIQMFLLVSVRVDLSFVFVLVVLVWPGKERYTAQATQAQLQCSLWHACLRN